MKSGKIILFDVREIELMEYQAQKNKMSVADYIRMCVFIDMIMAGNMRALAIVSNRIKGYIADRIKNIMMVQDKKTGESLDQR